GTIGVAFMGVGLGLGVNPAMTAGCVACGAFFGDKMSPMSDSTNYAAAVAETDLYKHVKSMFFTTGPATIVSLIIFFIIGRGQAGADEGTIQAVIDGLSGAYNLNIALLIPLIVMIVLIILKVPALPCIGLCALLGAVFGMIFQGHSLAQALTFLMSGHVGNTGLPDIDRIITRGGMSSMYGTIGIMLWSLSMAGLFMRTGMVDAIMEKLQGLTKTRVGLIMTHLVTGYVLSFVAADPYLAMIIPARAFGPKYDEMGIDRCVTSRTCEDSGTLVCPMVPWGTSGVYTAATLGVATTSYLPFYTLGYINPIFVLICAITGFGIFKAEKKAE
ncbi:MAG: Na+/H+ antiporter NhaC, partial [Clostridia bacterium]|nr:Na+/H+ antiporter NhaC [Clostridia bacterium]